MLILSAIKVADYVSAMQIEVLNKNLLKALTTIKKYWKQFGYQFEFAEFIGFFRTT